MKQLRYFLCLLVSVFSACHKADNFYDKLQALPQIDNSQRYIYKTAYIVGDTMKITGRLQSQNNLSVTIGGEAAVIVKVDSVYQGDDILEQVSLLITEAMEGREREVNVTSGGYTVTGNPIDVYQPGGPGSFTDSLKAVPVKNFADNQHVFLYCNNGKGDIYYYETAAKMLKHLRKDGSEETLYDLSGTPDAGSDKQVSAFIAGGVDPQGQHLYFSVQTNAGDYRFVRLDLATRRLETLNESTELSAPYEGNISSIHTIISRVYPDAMGNLYLGVGGTASSVDAIARYTPVDGQFKYIYKGLTNTVFSGMPGANIMKAQTIRLIYCNPDEDLLYAFEYSNGSLTTTFEVHDLRSRVLLKSLAMRGNEVTRYDVITPFSGLGLELRSPSTENSFGYLPMPGQRLMSLLYQSLATPSGFPKWVVFDFNEQRTYAYAPGRFNRGNYQFQPISGTGIRDELLNTDEAGNLYMTANGKRVIIRTETTN